MQENEFEKRLQEEMGEFRLRPSDVVWNKIEEQLKRKKRRRVVFFIFLLAGLSLMGYTGYFLTSTTKKNLAEQGIATTDKNILDKKNEEPAEADAQNSIPEDQTIAKPKRAKEKKQIILPIEHNTGQGEGERTIEKKPGQAKRPATLNNAGLAKSKELKLNGENKTTGEKITDQPRDKDNIPVVESTTITTGELAEKNSKPDEELTPEKKEIDPAKSDSAIAAIEKQQQKLPVDQQKAKKKTRSAIKWGIDFSAGVSQVQSKALSLSAVSSADALYANVPGNNAGGNPNASTTSFDGLRGFAFKAGIIGEKTITRRSSVAAGLGYAYYSNNIVTGAHKDSSFVLRTMTAQSVALDSYYQGSQGMEYTNHYHFIQLPIYYQLQLNKGVKVPIIWSIGVAPAYLFSTNALVYDTAGGGIYYKNNAAFNKFHFNLNTGLSLRFGKPNKMQWSVGPELSWDMTGLMKDAVQKRYFLYGGVTGRLYFKKKNSK